MWLLKCFRTKPKENTHTDWFKIVFLQLNRNTGLAQAADVNDGPSKENLHFDDQSKQVVFLFFFVVFSKRNREHFSQVIETIVKVWESLKKL